MAQIEVAAFNVQIPPANAQGQRFEKKFEKKWDFDQLTVGGAMIRALVDSREEANKVKGNMYQAARSRTKRPAHQNESYRIWIGRAGDGVPIQAKEVTAPGFAAVWCARVA